MHLVYNEYHVARRLDFIEKSEYTGLKLTPELCTRHKCRKVNKIYLNTAKLIRNVSVSYSLGERLGDSRLTNTRLTYKTRIILLPAAKDLHNSVKLTLATDYSVKLTVSRTFRKIAAIGIEIFVLLTLIRILTLLSFFGASLPLFALCRHLRFPVTK